MAHLIRDGEPQDRYPLFKNITRIGSDPSSDVQVAGDDVAPDHAHVLREGDAWVLASLGRGRPLLVNGKKEKRARLKDGDVIEIAATRLTFALVEAEGAVAATGEVDEAPAHSVHAYREIVTFSEKLLRSQD